MTSKAGEFWVADIRFTDGTASKKRQVLILWTEGNDVVAAAVTSAKPRSSRDVLLVDWRASGLRSESTVRLSRLDCLERSTLIGRIGAITKSDGERVRHAWQTHVVLEF